MIDLFLLNDNQEEAAQFPENWNELNYAELMDVVGHLLFAESTRQELLLKILQGRCSVDVSNLNADTFFTNEEYLGAFLELNTLTRFIKPKQTKAYLISKNSKETIYPDDDFNCLTVGEFEQCMQFLLSYQAADNIEEKTKQARCIASVLFSTLNDKGKRLSKEELTTADKAAVKIKCLAFSPKYVHILVLWFIGCASQLPTYFPMTYATEPDSDSEVDHMAVTKMIHAAARDKEPNARSIIRKVLLKEFLYDCELSLQKLEDDKQ